jgi:hypothetical protein
MSPDPADFWVRVAATVATFLAVLAALFREWFQARVFPPVLVLTLVDRRGTALTAEYGHIVKDEKLYPTASRWYRVRVTNDRRHMSPATDTQVVLLELGIPNAVGDLIWQSAGDLPLPVTHEGMLRPGRIIGRPLVCDLCNVYQRSGPEEGAPPLFGLAIRVPIKDLPLQRTQPFEMALRLQARSVEKDSNVLTLKIMWNGKWSDDTEQMANHLVIDKE